MMVTPPALRATSPSKGRGGVASALNYSPAQFLNQLSNRKSFLYFIYF